MIWIFGFVFILSIMSNESACKGTSLWMEKKMSMRKRRKGGEGKDGPKPMKMLSSQP
jgi:hypothetical protein